ncbi:MAG TPA: TIGR01212 family radical SAM protein, partial [Spirochaetota bacterium]|nr:TIGR01212 family radical SAM protein [Spirochaetota bacterium]
IPVNAGFTCPNRDGTKGWGGCTYCNNTVFAGGDPRLSPAVQVRKGIDRALQDNPDKKFIIYFQPYTNTYAPAAKLKEIYDAVLAVCPEKTAGLAVGTRADCLDHDRVQLLAGYTGKYDVTVELGMESIYDKTLQRINRGHSFADFCRSVKMINRLRADLPHDKFNICAHIILGFPWESEQMQLAYTKVINEYKFTFIKLHHLHVVKNTALAKEYQRDKFELYTLENYALLLSKFIARLHPDIVIQRLFATAPPAFNLAPQWHLDKNHAQQYIEKILAQQHIRQGSLYR